MLNAHWLNTFKTLVEVGHFTKTAETLYMTQPGVSQHIKKLESQLDTLLLEKSGKQFELTEAGKQVYQFVLQQHEDEALLRNKIEIDSPYIGECLFAMSGSLCMQFQPIFLDRQLKHRDLTISLEAAPNSRIVASVLDNKIDAGIVTQEIPSALLNYSRIGEETLCLVAPHSFTKQNWQFDDLIALGLIDHPDCEHYLSRFMTANKIERPFNQIPRSGYINQLSQILYPVAKGLGFTVLPVSAVKAFLLQDKISILPVTTVIKEPLFLVQKQRRTLPIRYQWFIQTIQSTLN